MRFGHFYVPMSLDPAYDLQHIDDCLYEAELAENLGLDAIWLSEHHFGGETAYADPLVFGGAIAAKTKRVLIGFGVIELAFHNPVRLAVQTALLDNMSRGRLIVGTGRGSRYNAFEYLGFGTTVDTGRDILDEAEDLLVKAWTGTDLDFKGKFWQVSFPTIRPKPYQQPHPPLARACVTEESVKEMARIGRPILIYSPTINGVRRLLSLYRETMISEGFDEPAVERALDECWAWRDSYIAETNEQAMDEFLPAFDRAITHMNQVRERYNPKDLDLPKRPAPLAREHYGTSPSTDIDELMVGSPKRVAEHVAMLRDAGARNLMLTHRGLPSREQTATYLRLLAEKVMPLFK